LGHLIRFRSRSLTLMVMVNRFLHPPQRNS
jgi:hypothetical protein